MTNSPKSYISIFGNLIHDEPDISKHFFEELGIWPLSFIFFIFMAIIALLITYISRMCFQGCKCSDSNNVNNKNFTTTTCYYSYFFIASLIFLATHLTSNVEPSIEYGISHTTHAIESLSSSLYPELVQFNNISNSFLQFIESDDTDRCLRSLPVTIDTSSINSHKNNSINDGNNDMKEKLIHFSSLLLPILNRTISVEHFLSPPSSSSNSNSNSSHNIYDVINRVSSKIYNKSSGVTYRFQHYWYFVMTILSILLLLKQKLLLQLMLFPVIIITILMTIPTASIMTGNLYVASICANDGAMHHLVHLLNSISHNSINHGSRSSRSSRLLISSDSDLFNRKLSANADDSHSYYLHDGSSSSSSSSSSRKDKIIETLIYYLQDNPISSSSSSSSSSDDPVLSLVAKVNQPLHIIISSATNEINQINKISSSSMRNNNSDGDDGDDDRDRHGDTWNSSQLHEFQDLDKVKGCLNRMSQTATSVVSATDNIGASLSWSIIHNLLEEIIVDGVCDGVGNAVSVIVISSISNIVMIVILIWHISILYNSFDSNNSSNNNDNNNNGNDDETELSYLLGEHGQGDKHNRDVNPDLTYASTGMTTIPTTNTSTTGNDAYLPLSSLQDHELATITTEQNRRRRSLFSPDKSSKRETTGNKQ